MNAKQPTRRERQSELLKKEILEAAAQVFKEYGYERATTKKIAERAEVSEGTLYNYFKNKRDILINLFKLFTDSITNNLTILSLPTDDSDIKKMFATILTKQLSFNMTYPILTLLLNEARIDTEIQKEFFNMIQSVRNSALNSFKQLEKEGFIRKSNYIAFSILMSTIAIGYTSLVEAGDNALIKMPIEKLTNEIADILFNGLVPKKK